jgi:hypothetical protein
MIPFNIEQFTADAFKRLPPPPRFVKGFLTGVGSRETPAEIQRILFILAGVLYSKGYIWRSGGADGADEAFERGILNHPHYRQDIDRPPMEIYLPWNGFAPVKGGPKKWENVAAGYFNTPNMPMYDTAQQIAMRIHPLGEKMRDMRGVFALHTRNVYQILGMNLAVPSKSMYLWAPPTKDDLVSGGTRTAVALAREHKVPWNNLANELTKSKVLDFLRMEFEALQKAA